MQAKCLNSAILTFMQFNFRGDFYIQNSYNTNYQLPLHRRGVSFFVKPVQTYDTVMSSKRNELVDKAEDFADQVLYLLSVLY